MANKSLNPLRVTQLMCKFRFLALFVAAFCSAPAVGQNDQAPSVPVPSPSVPTAAPAQSQPFQLHVESNLVVVRVVVRDSQGRPLTNLKKENFSLFDNGEQQTISQF